MKRTVALILCFSVCVLFCSCTPLSKRDTISYNDDATEIYYNGYTYINYNNYNGKYRYDLEKDMEDWVEIATIPYGYFYILGAVTIFYGNNAEKPDIITTSRGNSFYVREDVTIDHSLTVSVCDTDTPFVFRIAEVTTENRIAYDLDKQLEFQRVCNFFVTFEDYPGVRLWIEIYEYNSKLYMQDAWNSDYYEITDAFKEDLYEFGINTFDYH